MRRRRRLPRILLDATITVSLVLCLATAVMWVRSYWIGGIVDRRGNQNDETAIYWQRGRLGLVLQRNAFTSAEMAAMNFRFSPPRPVQYHPREVTGYVRERPDDLAAWWGRYLSTTTTTDVGWGGVRYRTGKLGGTHWLRQYVLPLWVIAGSFAAVGCALLRFRRLLTSRDRSAAHCCPTCAYDLRATPHRCPECGTMRA